MLRYRGPFICYLAATLVAWAFCVWTGRAMMQVGLRCRRYLPPEFAHRAFLLTTRWRFWTPAWAEYLMERRGHTSSSR